MLTVPSRSSENTTIRRQANPISTSLPKLFNMKLPLAAPTVSFLLLALTIGTSARIPTHRHLRKLQQKSIDASTYVPTLMDDYDLSNDAQPPDAHTYVPTLTDGDGSDNDSDGSSQQDSSKPHKGDTTYAPTMDATLLATSELDNNNNNVATMDPTLATTLAPSEAVTTRMNIATMNPTLPATMAPTDAPTLLPTTMAPTVAPTLVPTTRAPITEVPTMAYSFENTCQDNPINYEVMVDVQISFPNQEFAACDSAEQEAKINRVIARTLNIAFPSTVSDWDGDAYFGDFLFVDDQEVNNADPFGDLRQRRGLLRANAKPKTPQGRRGLQQKCTCSTRSEDCSNDYCRWGCLEAATTDCGTSALTNWANLADDVQKALAQLGYDCLGVPDELVVIVKVGDEEKTRSGKDLVEEEEAVVKTFHEDTPSIPSLPSVDPNSILNDLQVDPNSILNDLQDAADEVAADGKAIAINSKLVIEFSEGRGSPFTDEQTTALLTMAKAFFSEILLQSEFGNEFLDFDVTGLTSDYDAATETLTFTFTSVVDLSPDTIQTARTLATAMSNGDYEHYIGVLTEHGIDSVYKVKFTATGHGERL